MRRVTVNKFTTILQQVGIYRSTLSKLRKMSPCLPDIAAPPSFLSSKTSLHNVNGVHLLHSLAVDDIHINLSFPEKNISSHLDKKEALPVIILLGWAGSSIKQLSKYAEFYRKEGCITLECCSINMWQLMFKRIHRSNQVADSILEVLQEFDVVENPIFFHLFSNGGAVIYLQVLENFYQRCGRNLDLKGCILDSLPGKYSAIIIMRATFNVFTFKYKLSYYVISTGVFFVLLMYNMLCKITAYLTRKPHIAVHCYYDRMKNDRTRCPQLFLFSKLDVLIPYEHVQEVINYRKCLGVDVKSICWTDSPHVKHFVVHKEAYSAAVRSFLFNCLSRT